MAPPPNAFDPTVLPAEAPCPFCEIANTYPTYDPTAAPASTAPLLDPERIQPASFVVLSTPTLLAFLDIMPLSRGHLLLCPRRHAAKLTDVTAAEAAELGALLRVLSAALVRATGVADWNVVQNNGAAAAQVVGHVHYHLIPRPELRDAAVARARASFTMFGRGQREELDDDEAAVLAADLRARIRDILLEEKKGAEDEKEAEAERRRKSRSGGREKL
ncbi:HIT-like domain-containing protein [Xylariales sp. PMI_506]|nr:HIT-like domain-containing protein [Xylariales sp. PMI_506]